MKYPHSLPLVTTVKELCRVCFTCVRECPAKAIRIADGQAEVIPERCIGCGNCVRVCSQQAKQVRDCTANVQRLFDGTSKVAACVAPSFPAEFAECDYGQFVGMLRALGFDYVHEVAFGADLVARRYRDLVESAQNKHYIATTCPAVVAFVERYYPDLVPSLAPIVSPMVAMARVVRRLYGDAVRVVFIGPCIAKKGEMLSDRLPREIEATLAFTELRHMFHLASLTPEKVTPSDFDPPMAGPGAQFAISRGLIRTAGIEEDLVTGEVVTADGREKFVEAIREFEAKDTDPEMVLLEVLACTGCISGPGISNTAPLYRRRKYVSRYCRERREELDPKLWMAAMERFSDLDLSRTFEADDQRMPAPSQKEIEQILERMGKTRPQDQLNCGSCGYETCREHAIAIFNGLAESEMCLPYNIDQLQRMVQELAETQEALMQSEKLASMGQLAAGIAHELNNPLGVVLMYTHLLQRERSEDGALREDLRVITDQADRCKKIVSGLLHFARQNKVLLQQTSMRDIVIRALRSVVIPDNVTVQTDNLAEDPDVDVDRDQIVQVLTNLVTNACAAMPNGGLLRVETRGDSSHAEFRVIDTGTGIAKELLGKIFEPFFTTKGIQKGTGLGLAISYGIVKMHSGDIRVETNADPAAGPTGSTFIVSIPRHGKN